MGVFCQIRLWWERQEPGEGAREKGQELCLPQQKLYLLQQNCPFMCRVEKSPLPGCCSGDLQLWVVGFPPPPCIFSSLGIKRL